MRSRLISERKKKNLTQKQAASMIGISEVFLRKLESGKKNPSLSTISKLVILYDSEDKELFPDIFFYK